MSGLRMDIVELVGGVEDFNALQKRLDDLVALGGREKIVGMLDRFAGHLERFLETPPGEPWPIPETHRLVGLAGILGFFHLERCARAVEVEAPRAEDLLAARSAAEGAVRFVDAWRRPTIQ